jgi:hypothetical protein
MAPVECPHEASLLDALQTSAWPDRCDERLLGHVAACPSCTELLAVVVPILQVHQATVRDAVVPPSGLAWWRLQARARQEAAERAVRPIAALQGVALAVALGLLAGVAGVVWRFWVWLAAASVEHSPSLAKAAPGAVALLTPGALAALVGAVVVVLLAPVAVYLAARDH